MKKKIIIAVGGTGGHIYPALAVAEDLLNRENNLEILFVGGGLKKSVFFDQTYPYVEIECGSLSWRKPLNSLLNAGKILKGVAGSYNLLKKFKPSLLLGFGSYHTLPILLAAKQAQVPYILHEQNSILGRVNRLFVKKALFTAIFFPCTQVKKGEVREVGMPLRRQYRKGSVSKEEAKKYFGFTDTKPLILVFGGSQGAKHLNEQFMHRIARVKNKDFSVLHFTGNPIATKAFKAQYEEQGISACVKDFELRMDYAWQAADLLVSRSGAGTIAEQMEFEVPGILIPYPYAMDNHQESNADFMVHQVEGAIKLSEKEFTTRNLLEEALSMLFSEKLLIMKRAIHKYKERHKPNDFCSLILRKLNS